MPATSFSRWAPLKRKGRSRVARRMFPATVQMPGDSEIVAIDALGRSSSKVLAAQPFFHDRHLVTTDVVALQSVEIPYEYLPAATD